MGDRPTISSSGNVFEAPITAELKPLTPEQLSIINTLKNPLDKLIAQLLVDGRKQGKPVTMEELAASGISMIKNRKPIIDDGEEIDGEKTRAGVGRHIFSSLRPKFERVGLFIINDYHTGKKGKSSYVLRTREELPSQEELAQFRTLQDISSAIGEPDLATVHSKLDGAKKKDPTIEVLHLPDGRNSRKVYVTQDDFEKIKAIIATRTVVKNGTDNNKKNTSDTPKKKPQNKKFSPSEDEVEKRAMLRRTPEQIREKLIMDFTNVILSHLAKDFIEDLNKSPRELLENALSNNKIKLDSVTKEPPEQFLMDKFIERLLGLWHILDAQSTNSVLQKQAVEYCLELKQKGYNIRDIVDNTSSHFSIPSPFTSVQAL